MTDDVLSVSIVSDGYPMGRLIRRIYFAVSARATIKDDI